VNDTAKFEHSRECTFQTYVQFRIHDDLAPTDVGLGQVGCRTRPHQTSQTLSPLTKLTSEHCRLCGRVEIVKKSLKLFQREKTYLLCRGSQYTHCKLPATTDTCKSWRRGAQLDNLFFCAYAEFKLLCAPPSDAIRVTGWVFEKNAQYVTQLTSVKLIRHIFFRWKTYTANFGYLLNKKLPIENNRPVGENSLNLVTLDAIHAR
jgi:hypothetical protein